MLSKFEFHNKFKQDLALFLREDPQLGSLARLKYQHSADWWSRLSLETPGIYILTGGRQVGKSTSCKLLIAHCLQKKIFTPETTLYLPCDEIYDASELSNWITQFLDSVEDKSFLLIVDEITFVKNWDRVIKSIADQGRFSGGICLLTGSDTLILKEAAMSFPGRRGNSSQTDFHISPLSFFEYVNLLEPENKKNDNEKLSVLFNQYLQCGGYLRAINDFAEHGYVLPATLQTYEQWIRGDFLKKGKKERYLLDLLHALLSVGVSQISYSALTEKIGSISKETCLDYCDLLQRMDVIFDLQAYDQNKKLGFPKKARKIHFVDPFIRRAIQFWLMREGYSVNMADESLVVESVVASHCHRYGRAFYFKGQGEIDVIHVAHEKVTAIEVKWTNQTRQLDLKTLKQFHNAIVVTKTSQSGFSDGIKFLPIYRFLVESFMPTVCICR